MRAAGAAASHQRCPRLACPNDRPLGLDSGRGSCLIVEPWFIKFKPDGPWYSPKCDNNWDPPKCSDYYHMQEQTPGYPHGDGDCAAPGCDCGTVPCGFYLFNHSSTAVVKGKTFLDWFIHDYVLNRVGLSALVSGFFWDECACSSTAPESICVLCPCTQPSILRARVRVCALDLHAG